MNQCHHHQPLLERGLCWLYGRALPTESPEATHRLRLLLISSAFIGAASLTVLLIQLSAFIDPFRVSPPLTDILMGVILSLTAFTALRWSRHDRITSAARLLIVIMLTYALAEFLQGGAPSRNLSSAQTGLLTVVLAQSLLGSRAGWVTFGVTAVGFVVLEVLWRVGIFPAPSHGEPSRAFFAIVAWAVAGGLIVLIAKTTLNVLRRQAASLEAEVAARTAALRASEQRFRALYEHSPDSFLLIDPETWTIVDCNEAACRMKGYTREELIGAHLSLLNPPDIDHDPDANLLRLRNGERLRFELAHVRKDGTRIAIEVTNSLVIIEGRELVLGIDRDITQQKQAEQSLRQALAAEIEMNLLRSRVLSMASHDLRTPLAAIQTTCDIIQHHSDQMTGEKLTAEHKRVRSIIKRMGLLLDDMLTLARTAPTELEAEAEPVDLVAFCQALIDEHRRADNHAHRIILHTEGTPYPLRLYRSPLHHIVTNILGNALKYSPPHSTVRVELRFDLDHVTLTVTDEGRGIPAEDQDNLFAPFFRASNAGQVEGTGLGLSIVQQSLALLGGTIALDSTEHVGTTVTITLPCPSPAAPAVSSP